MALEGPREKKGNLPIEVDDPLPATLATSSTPTAATQTNPGPQIPLRRSALDGAVGSSRGDLVWRA